jgi:UTP--glucose-1-phosphate uridylyltransferase
MKKIKKAIIPAAGLGTRFLPATKAMPKEMLPIVDKPTIQYIVEEAIESGIEDIIIVTGKGKRAIEDHFDHAFELEQNLFEKGKIDLLNKVKHSSSIADIHYIRQKEPMGLGHAIWCARKFIGEEPFAVLLGDDIVQAPVPCLKQLINQFEITESSIVGVKEIPNQHTNRYGIIDPASKTDKLYAVNNLIEKPSIHEAPSNLAIMGRYILTPNIFKFLEIQEKGSGGEIQLTDALQQLNKVDSIFAYEFEGTRYDVGEKLGFITTTIEIALRDHPSLKVPLLKYIETILEKNTTINI